MVFREALSGGFDFPTFESRDNRFIVMLGLNRCEEFREIVRRRSQSLGQLEEILVLRLLRSKETATAAELS